MNDISEQKFIFKAKLDFIPVVVLSLSLLYV